MVNFSVLFIVFLPFVGSMLLVFFNFNEILAKKIGLLISLVTFFLSLFFWVFFNNATASFQFLSTASWLSFFNIVLAFGIDGISLFFILLTTFLVPLCLVFSWDTSETFKLSSKNYFAAFLLMESFILVVFTTLDLFIFYVFFEAVLIPIFIIMGFWGTRDRKSRASFFLFLYTVLGSLFMLVGILFIFFTTGTTNFLLLLDYSFCVSHQKILWLAFFFSFSVKVPIVPVHLWLPEAHVEAPTEGSVLLAGILLKLGSYGLIRFSMSLFPLGSLFFRPLVFFMGILAVIYTSITALRQTDMKRVIAYASVAHINITLLGLFSFSLEGVQGAVFQMISHGIVSGALFFCIGVLYSRHHTKLIYYYSGLVQTIPIFVSFFLLFTMANVGLPGTSSFVGEFLILLGVFSTNTVCSFFAASSMVFGGCYALWLFNRIAYGNVKSSFLFYSADLTKKEFVVLFPLAFLVLFIGILPRFFFETLQVSCATLFNVSHSFNL
jgi:NADH-quinone oxidoreductase subunit M